jgi:hypothetical protein
MLLIARGFSLKPCVSFFSKFVRYCGLLIFCIRSILAVYEEMELLFWQKKTPRHYVNIFHDLLYSTLDALSTFIFVWKQKDLQRLLHCLITETILSTSNRVMLLKSSFLMSVVTISQIASIYTFYIFFYDSFLANWYLSKSYLVICAVTSPWIIQGACLYFFIYQIKHISDLQNLGEISDQLRQERCIRKLMTKIIEKMNLMHCRFRDFEELFSVQVFLWFAYFFFSLSREIILLPEVYQKILQNPWYLSGYAGLYNIVVVVVLIFMITQKQNRFIHKTRILTRDITQSHCLSFEEKLVLLGSIHDNLTMKHTGGHFFFLDRQFIVNFEIIVVTYSLMFLQLGGFL